ncbi:hypothetical protein [Chitiniphilus eburneus]|uniref:hypothetical protein n=1 Tax=Chitiniphilus eburneus TaxID=2571148 RepID=UPI0035D0A0E7
MIAALKSLLGPWADSLVVGGVALLAGLLIGAPLGHHYGRMAGDLRTADIERDHARAVLDAVAAEASQRAAAEAIGDQLAASLVRTQAALADTRLQLTRRVDRVVTYFRPLPSAPPEPLPAAVVPVGAVRLWNEAHGLPVPAPGAAPGDAAATPCATATAGPCDDGLGPDDLAPSGAGLADLLTNHVDNATQCRAIRAQLDALIDWHGGTDAQ